MRQTAQRPMKRSCPFLVLVFVLATGPVTAQNDAWQQGTFEIRVFDVEQGDSQLIIFPSGFTILIDVAELSWNSHRGAERVAQKIRDITQGTHINVGVLSHLHLDHIGYATRGGFWYLIEREGITFDRIVDRDAGTWVDSNHDGLCDHQHEIVWHNAGTQGGTARRWLCYATDPTSAVFSIREIAQIGSTTQINVPDQNATVEIIETDAQGVVMEDGTTPLTGDHTGDSLPPSENDYSIALKITFGEIDYATAGDADGEYNRSRYRYTYNDIETVMAPRFGDVEILHADHHGSSHSSNPRYLETLSPDVTFISCGSNSYGHPGQEVLDRLLRYGDVYLTNVCEPSRDYQDTFIVGGDIILRSTDGVQYTVNGNGYFAGPPAALISSVVINEVLPNPLSGNPEWIELYNPSSQDIDISGAWIDDRPAARPPRQIPNGTTIPAGGYWTMDTNRFLRNRGDQVRLLMPDGTTVVESFEYTSSARGRSWYRSPDGGAWQQVPSSSPTKGGTNH